MIKYFLIILITATYSLGAMQETCVFPNVRRDNQTDDAAKIAEIVSRLEEKNIHVDKKSVAAALDREVRWVIYEQFLIRKCKPAREENFREVFLTPNSAEEWARTRNTE